MTRGALDDDGRFEEERASLGDPGCFDETGFVRQRPARPLRVVEVISAAALASREVAARSWLVPDLLPDRQVTLLSGDGGVGKSLLALQLAAAIASGTDWIGTLPAAGPVLYFGAEDELDEMHRRLVDIAAARDLDLLDFADLHLMSLAGEDAVLAAPDHLGLIAMTPLWQAVEAKVAELRPRLLIVDNSADVFAGNEIARAQVRQFVAALRGLAIRLDLGVLLLTHPSLSGMASGAGTSGSTAWSNSVRSRLYLDRPKPGDDAPSDPDVRTLRVMKANYAAVGAETRLRWQAGVLRLDGSMGLAGFDRAAADATAEDVFLQLLDRLTNQGRDVSHKPSPSFAPAVFAREPDNSNLQKSAFSRAMSTLFSRNAIRVDTFGPASKQRSRIVRA